MKKLFFLGILFLGFGPSQAQNNWKSVPGKIMTPWAEEVDAEHVLPEYPRPQMMRSTWKNLNGLWNYALTPVGGITPTQFQGQILVPYAIESALSGVGKRVGKDSLLWYETTFSIPAAFKNKNVLLHFGAVDWQTEVFVNGQKVGEHKGGFTPFSFNVTPYLKKGNQTLIVKVWDPTDEGPQPRGKQVKDPEGIWYTPVTGIWQTVWLEAVPESYIVSTKHTPDIDLNQVTIETALEKSLEGDNVKVIALDGGKQIGEVQVAAGKRASLKIENPKLWAPGNPFLYDLKVQLIRKGKVVDEITSYFAMRKSSLEKGTDGIQRMMLNNEFVFQFGPLDQGWWPDGLYTAPTDAALKFDIEKTRDMGFNMIRKHIKVEPARWYYYCDSIGVLVWQDMPSGDLGNRWNSKPGIYGLESNQERTPESEKYFREEWEDIIDALYNHPSIVSWIPFNEAWGQFKTEEITKWTMSKDSTRLVNSASGGNFYDVGDIIDIHNYPDPAMPKAELFGSNRALVLGEYGGLGLPVDGHTWQVKDNWGYQSFKNADDLYNKYASFIDRLEYFITKGLSGAIYTQTTDVEVEINGLMTYDRKVIKIPVEKLKKLHSKLFIQ